MELAAGKNVEISYLKEPNVENMVRELELEPGGDPKADVVDDGIPHVGMAFKSFEEAYDFYNEYARRTGFGTKIRRSWYSLDGGELSKVTLTCCKEGKRAYKSIETCSSTSLRLSARTGCKARVKVQMWYPDGMFHFTEVIREHNHPINPEMSKYFRSHRSINDGIKRIPLLRGKAQKDLACGVNKDEHSNGKAQPSFLSQDDIEALQLFLVHMQSKTTNFFHIMDLDVEGHVKNVFWASGRSRVAYQYFGDVITLDTTYLTGNFETPLALFIGVNHHGHLILLGCGLLSDRSTSTYQWLFKSWLSCMSGSPPNAMITDDCEAIKEAVADVFPSTRHRLCLWSIMRRMQEFLGRHAEYKAVQSMMKKVVYDSLRVDEFEKDWKNMVQKHGLSENDWLKSLYENRHSWAPVFVKDTFWAGMSTIKDGDSTTSFFDGYIFSKTSIEHFVSKYEVALQNKYEKEFQADIDCFHKNQPQLISKFYMEDQVCKIYTIDMFKKFQDEVKAMLYCTPSLINAEGPTSTFMVKEPIQLKDSNMVEYKNYEVTYNSNDVDVRCICCSFQFGGILCRHALSVLNYLEIYEIPLQYILERWRKDYKHVHILSSPANATVANGPMERFENVCKYCLKFAEVAAVSNDNYEVAIKIISEAIDKLIKSDCLISKPHIRVCNLDSERNLIIESDEIQEHMQHKRKGQPVKRRKESLVEKIVKNSKKKMSQRKPIVNSKNDIIQIAPNTPQFKAPMWAEESIDLTEQVSPTNLSIGGHFGMPANHQHATDNQSGLRWSFQQIFQQTHTTEAPLAHRQGEI